MSWVERAACRNHPVVSPDAWMEKVSLFGKWSTDAVNVCWSECPVREQCLDLALRTESGPSRWGVYGGLTPRQRERYTPVCA